MRISLLNIIIIVLTFFFPFFTNAMSEEGTTGITTAPISLIDLHKQVIAKSDVGKPIKLISPAYKKQITTLTPVFRWHHLSDDSIEYRLLISKANGKIVLDKWIKQDTTYHISPQNSLEDLTPYYWMVYGYKNDQFYESPVWSFWIDRDVVTDLEVRNIEIINPRKKWQAGDRIKISARVYNRGTTDAEKCFVTLFSGNLDENYFNNYALRKTISLNSVTVTSLKAGDSKKVMLSAILPYGYNDLYLYIEPGNPLNEMYFPNNSQHVIKLQTEDNIVKLHGLFMIYTSYRDPQAGLQFLKQNDLKQIYNIIGNLKHFIWDNTRVLQVSGDTLIISRLLKDNNFIYQNDQWGYLLPEKEVQRDLIAKNTDQTKYDFIFVFYAWHNSPTSWSGYSGYTFDQPRFFNKKIPFSAQPVYPGKEINQQITIHEFLHMLHYFLSKSGEPDFYTPHDRTQITTFTDDLSYFKWVLETFPTEKWLLLNKTLMSKSGDMRLNSTNFIDSHISDNFILSQNYPNPFNRATFILYEIPAETESGNNVKVTLTIYDLLGNKIRTLVNEYQQSGSHRIRWDGLDKNGNIVPSSIYFYELRVGDQLQIKKMLFIQ